MSDSLSARLVQATERLRGKRKVEAMLRQAQAMLNQAQQTRASLLAQLQQEERDVAEIEGQTLTALVFWIISQQDEKIAKERQELVAAKLRYEEAGIAVAANTECCDEYRRQIAEMAPIETEFKTLLEQKRRLVLERHDGHAAGLAKIEFELSIKHGLEQELQEVIKSGQAALAALIPLRASLHRAKHLARVEGYGESHDRSEPNREKHSKLDDARGQARVAQERLRSFRTELADSIERLNISLDFDDFTTFMDNCIDIWIVDSAINRAFKTCDQTIGEVHKVIEDCCHKLTDATSQTGQLIERRLAWILKG